MFEGSCLSPLLSPFFPNQVELNVDQYLKKRKEKGNERKRTAAATTNYGQRQIHCSDSSDSLPSPFRV